MSPNNRIISDFYCIFWSVWALAWAALACTVSEMDSWKLSTKRDRPDALTSPYKYMIGNPTHLFKPEE